MTEDGFPYPTYADDFVPESAEHERQVRYLRDALTVLLGDYCVTGNNCILGYFEPETVYIAPDVLVYDRVEVVRGTLGLGSSPGSLNPHPSEGDRRFLLAIDVTGRCIFPKPEGPLRSEALLVFGLEAYLHYDLDLRVLSGWRLVDREPIEVCPDRGGKCRLADLGVGFAPDDEGFLRVYSEDGKRMPRYEEKVERIPTAYDKLALADQVERRRQRARAKPHDTDNQE